MPIKSAIWKVGKDPRQLSEVRLESERLLEEMIVSSPAMLSEEWMLIGQQESTGYGGRIDLLAIAPDGALILIEIKRDRTPREVVAQALDYASWVEKLQAEDIAAIYSRFAQGKRLAEEFQKRFGHSLDEDALNQSHQIVIVAGSLDDSSERIVSYLSERDIPINVLFFQVFGNGSEQLISRTWLLDPIRTQVSAATTPDAQKEPWNGEFYASFGHGESRSWNEAVKYNFISSGGGAWYSKTLQMLDYGDRIWVNVPGAGYVGVGKVISRAQPALEFKSTTNDTPILDLLSEGSYHRELSNDYERCEYFVGVEWLETVPLEKAVKEIGFFGNQNTICKPTTPKWRHTVERLKQHFPDFDKASVADVLA